MLKLPEDKNKPLRLFYADWKKTMDFIQNQFQSYYRFYTNGFINPYEVSVDILRETVLRISPIHDGFILNGKFFISNRSIEFDITKQSSSYFKGIYVLYIEIEEKPIQDNYPLDPFQPIHEYIDFGIKVSLEDTAISQSFNPKKLFLTFVYIDKNKILKISQNTYSLKKAKNKVINIQSHPIGDLIFSSNGNFQEGVSLCNGSYLSIFKYPLLYDKITYSYGIEFSNLSNKRIPMKFAFSPIYSYYIVVEPKERLEILETYPYFVIEIDSKKKGFYSPFKIEKRIAPGSYVIRFQYMPDEMEKLASTYYTDQTVDGYSFQFLPLTRVYDILLPKKFAIPNYDLTNISKGTTKNILVGIVTDDILKETDHFEIFI